MLRPARIAKVRMFVTKKDYDILMDILNDTAALHIEPLGQFDKEMLDGVENGENFKELTELLQHFRALESHLNPRKPSKRVSFRNTKELISAAKKIEIWDKVAGLAGNLASDNTYKREASDKVSILSRLEGLGEDLSILSNDKVSSFILTKTDSGKKGKSDAFGRLKAAGKYLVFEVNGNPIASVKKDQREEFAAFCKSEGIGIEFIPQMKGSVPELRSEAESELRRVEENIATLNGELNALSSNYYNSVSAIREELEIETEKLEAAAKFGSTDSVIMVEGWIEEKNIDRIKRLFSKATHDKFIVETIDTKEVAPTKLANPKKFRLFESFVRFYSLPKSNELDPTLFFAFVFPVFFGFMVGDVGYGLFMFLMFFWIAHRINHPPKKSHIPRGLARFVHTIVSNRGLLILSKAVMIGSIVAMGFGFIFNNFFGFRLPYAPLFNVETQLSTLLLISGWIGVVMVEFGYAIGVVNRLYVNDRKGAVGRVGWFLAAIGIVLVGLNVLHKASMTDINAISGYLLIPIGIALVLKSEGTEALMEIPSVVSHILSYMRLVGILLASVILAEVIDKIFLANVGASFLMALVGGVILIFGQLFNIVIAIFEGGIQGARLIYVEFFSKFFSGNGRQFRPFGISRKRTNYKFTIEEH